MTFVAIVNKPSSKPPPRIGKWVLFLQSYDFTVQYWLRKDNPSDNPSWHLLQHIDEEMTSSQGTEAQVRFINCSIPDAVSLEYIKRETELDPVLHLIISVIQ